ncbi:MAG: hypothetical protein AAF989_01970, partial [Planctomycetota bacterium]
MQASRLPNDSYDSAGRYRSEIPAGQYQVSHREGVFIPGIHSLKAKSMMNRWARSCWILLFAFVFSLAIQRNQVVSGNDADRPLPASVAASTSKVPPGFHVSVFASEPDVMQPIGFCLDDRGRLWVAEAYNYPNHGTKPG